MPQDVIDYSNTVFYKIYCKDPAVKDLYVGHTTNFVQRKYHHKRTCIKENDANHHLKVYKFIRENGGWDNWKMDIIGYKDCYDHYEARKTEQKYFETLKATLNSIEPLPKPKPRPQMSKETIKHKCDVNRQQMNEMTEQKEQENASVFICVKCSFKCSKKSNYNKHLLTAKHKMLENAGNKKSKNAELFKCVCGKEYKHNQSYYRHKKKCIHNNTDCDSATTTTNDNSTILNIITQNKELMNLLVIQNQEHKEETKELMKQNQEMQKTIQELVPKIGNNNTTTNNNNQFNLQVFLNEDCKDAINFSDFIKQIQVSFEDIENQAECGYVKGISKLFIDNLKELGTNKRPIHCTDKKRKTLYIKENDEWDKEGSQDTLKNGIQEITRSTMRTLIKEKVNRAEEFADMESDFSKQCLVIQRNLIPTAPRETAFSKVMENITKNSGIIE